MSPGEKIVVLRKIFADFAATGAVDELLELLTEDVVYRVTVAPGTPLSGEFKGLDGVREYFSTALPAAVEHLGFNVYDFLANADTAVVTGDEVLRIVKNGESYVAERDRVITLQGGIRRHARFSGSGAGKALVGRL